MATGIQTYWYPRVNKCCCCIPLRVGSLLIGYISILLSCLSLAAISFYTYKVATYVEKPHAPPSPPPQELEKSALNLYITFGYYVLVFLYNLFMHVVLVVGVHSNRPRYLNFYCSAAYFLFALAVALIILTCIFMGFVAMIPILKWAFTLAVCIIVVRSTQIEMEEQLKPRVYEMQNLYIRQPAPTVV